MLVPELQCSSSTDRDGSRLLASLLTHSPTKHIAMAHDMMSPIPILLLRTKHPAITVRRAAVIAVASMIAEISLSLFPCALHLPPYRRSIGSASPSIYDLSQQLAVLIRLCARRHY